MVARRFFVRGDVQGVGFRYFVLREVQSIGPGKIVGFVRNLYDGRVEIYAEGMEQDLQILEQSLKKGPRSGHVDGLDIFEEPANGSFNDFRIAF